WGPANFPIAPGHEIIAEVSQVGSSVKDFKKGDKVGFGTMRNVCGKCTYCTTGRETICQTAEDRFTFGKYWGGYATA
ncbi:MAG: alcohol dehydrogenase catalytic domain-containing protein, partial [Cetobacterium sp.]